MQKGKLIGTGRTAEVFEWGEDRILKLYFSWADDQYFYNREMENTVEVNHLKLPAPYMYDAVEIEGRKGMIFERLNGPSLLSHFKPRPHMVVHFARKLARLHHTIHQSVSGKLTPVKEQLSNSIRAAVNFADIDIQPILDSLEGLPEMNSVCHGDFHPDNIIVTKKGFMAIDWMNAMCGDPCYDVARTLLMIKSPYRPYNISNFIAVFYNRFKKIMFSAYLKKYIKLSGVTPERIGNWLLPAAAARLTEQVPGERDWLAGIIRGQRNIYTM